MWRLALFIFPAVGLSLAAGWARAAEVTIATDRPSVANSSVVVPQGVFQMENGMLASDLGHGAIVDLPESNIRYGLLPRTELRITLPDYFYSPTSATPSGFGDTALGVKQQLGPVGGFDVSIIAFLSLPTGANQISSHGYDPGLQIPWSHSLAENWTVAGQIAAYWPTVADRRNYTTEATVLLDRQLNARSDVFLELAVDSPQHGGSSQQLHAGTTYKLAPNQQIDLHAAAGLSRAAPRNYVGIGYSFLLQGR
jgi:outer membrane putative beta-barrel porin/alpha-amylase